MKFTGWLLALTSANEGHGWSLQKTSLIFYDAIEKFLAKHLSKT